MPTAQHRSARVPQVLLDGIAQAAHLQLAELADKTSVVYGEFTSYDEITPREGLAMIREWEVREGFTTEWLESELERLCITRGGRFGRRTRTALVNHYFSIIERNL